MKTADESLETVSDEELELKIQRAWEKRRLDMASKLNYAREQGFEQGFKQGFKEGFIEGYKEGIIKVAERMLKHDYDIEMIIEVTKLPLDKIKEIENSLKENRN